jgi:hypothetical protein
MKNVWIASALALACTTGFAKLPTPVLDDAAKAKAAETAAKTAWQGKLDAYQMCKAQDRVAAFYRKSVGSAPAAAASGAKPATPASAAAAPPAGMVAAAPAVPGGTAAAPAGAPTPTPCADPGAFAYNAPSEKPLETSGAHSPAGNATSPPSNRATSAEMAPAKK